MKFWLVGILLAGFSFSSYCAALNATDDDASLQRQLDQARVLLAGAKTAVAEFYGLKKRCPVTNAETGLAQATLLGSDWITETGVGASKGACTVAAKFGEGALPPLRGKFLGARLKPDSSWECFSDVDAKYLPCKQDQRGVQTPTATQSSSAIPQPAFKLVPPEPPREDYMQYYSKAYSDSSRGDFEQSLVDTQKGLEIAKRIEPAKSDGLSLMRKSTIAMLLVLKRDAEARQLVLEELRSEGQQDSERSVNIAMAQTATETAEALEFSENPNNVAKAPALFQYALDVNKKEFGPHSNEFAVSTYKLGNGYDKNNQEKEAEQTYRQALSLFKTQPGVDKSNVIVVETELASLMLKEHRYAEGEIIVHEASDLEAKQVSPNPNLDTQLHDLQEHLDVGQTKSKPSAKP
jgi:tetratricopeptide (TPR) repeat protein